MPANHLTVVRKALAEHVERGVFRNFQEAGTKGGKTVFLFDWLENRPLIFIYDDKAKSVQFKNCFPNVDAELTRALRAYVKGRSSSELPAHRRIDPAQSEARLVVRAGNGSLLVTAKRNQLKYAVAKLLNLLNESFVQLHGEFFEYMVREFDVSQD